MEVSLKLKNPVMKIAAVQQRTGREADMNLTIY